jgi:hypothetical protein
VLIEEFQRADPDAWLERWAYANTLAVLAGPEDADDLLELLGDRRRGRGREMLCDALKRTKCVPRAHLVGCRAERSAAT